MVLFGDLDWPLTKSHEFVAELLVRQGGHSVYNKFPPDAVHQILLKSVGVWQLLKN